MGKLFRKTNIVYCENHTKHKCRMQSFIMLKQVVHLVTTGLQRVKYIIIHLLLVKGIREACAMNVVQICIYCLHFSWVLFKCHILRNFKASVVTRIWHGEWGIRVQFLPGTRYFSLLHRVQSSPGAQPDSYPVDTHGSPLRIAAGMWTSIKCFKSVWSYTSICEYIFIV
jgi:hypothetical protein